MTKEQWIMDYLLNKKIAVHCKTDKQAVYMHTFHEGIADNARNEDVANYRYYSCGGDLFLDYFTLSTLKIRIGYDRKKWFVEKNYTIIEFDELMELAEQATKPQTLAEMLGVEEDREFGYEGQKYVIRKYQSAPKGKIYSIHGNDEKSLSHFEVFVIAVNKHKIINLFKWSEETIERARKDLACERFNYVARDEDNRIWLYKDEPTLYQGEYSNIKNSDVMPIDEEEYHEIKLGECVLLEEIVGG